MNEPKALEDYNLRKFWKQIFIARIRTIGDVESAARFADESVAELEKRIPSRPPEDEQPTITRAERRFRRMRTSTEKPQ